MITEKEADEMLEIAEQYHNAVAMGEDNPIIKMWKEKGFIKQSKLEEVREFASRNGGQYEKTIDETLFCQLAELYEEAIKELTDEL